MGDPGDYLALVSNQQSKANRLRPENDHKHRNHCSNLNYFTTDYACNSCGEIGDFTLSSSSSGLRNSPARAPYLFPSSPICARYSCASAPWVPGSMYFGSAEPLTSLPACPFLLLFRRTKNTIAATITLTPIPAAAPEESPPLP